MSDLQLLRQRLENTLQDGVIAVLHGGCSSERSVSLASGAAVVNALQAEGLNVEALDVQSDLMTSVQQLNPAFAFNLLHGGAGENGTVQAFLALANIPYSGSGVLGSALALDKLRAKQLWRGLQLPTPPFVALQESDDFARVLAQLGGCVFVKPASEGSSIGMSKVNTAEALAKAYSAASQLDTTVLVEQAIDGPEYTVAIVGDRLYPSIRIETQREFYTFAAKYEDDDTGFSLPSGLNASDELELQQLAWRAFSALGCSGWGRVDVMRDASSGQFHLLEVNTVPGMTNHSLVPKAANASGVTMSELCLQIIDASLERVR